jgi:hypothetical protein
MKGSQESLTTVVVKDAANWLTPQEDDSSNVNPKDTRRAGLVSQVNGQANWPTPDASNHRDGEVLRKDNNLEQGGFHGVSLHHAMTKYGQAAPANPSTDGSRQGLWLTPRANEPTGDSTFVTRNGDRGQHCSPSLTIQVEKTPQWMTPRACEAQNPPRGLEMRNSTGKLNPRWVETLMGLPVGWTMPSCASPVTIALTNCDSSATESCLQQPSELFEF